ncbi:MAG TPA: DUF885 family protein [Sphingomonas sp.]|nr:DUF885 family protein [Sphingomonas sp.]
MLDRRAFLLSSAALGGAAALPGWTAAAAKAVAGDAAPSPALRATFHTIFERGLRLRPEGATYLGLDKGANADLRSKLSDESDTGRAAARAATQADLADLAKIDRAGLSESDRIDYDTVLYTRKSAEAVEAFDFGGAGFSPSPYVVSQLTGAYQSVPNFLDTKHKIESKVDADAYLARLDQYGDQLDAQTERMRHDAGLGVVLPDFLLDTTLDQLTKTRTPAADALVVTSIARRAAAKGLGDGYGRDAAKLYDARIGPALDRQIALARELRQRATHDAGIWKFKDGPAYYAVALRATTTSAMSPDEVHQFGLDQAKAISSRLDGLLKAQGFSKGTIGERMAALYKDPRQLYPDTDAGKEQAIAYCNARLAAIRQKLPSVFTRMPPYRFEVRRVPPALEAGAPSAYSQGPALDGSRPGLVYFNLHDTAEWPKFCLATTVFHEGLPGHQMEGGLALSNTSLPLIRKTGGFSGYGEGWALYAEQLADEIGMYDDDPLGRLGYLKFQLFRANRCVVDTGIHHLKWGREQAIRYFVEQDGEAPGFATREVERYCAMPGQAASYKIGHSVFVGIREKAKAKMGPRFDIKAYHDAVLAHGRVPLEILQQIGDRWIAQAV